jgi:hypothetical protein
LENVILPPPCLQQHWRDPLDAGKLQTSLEAKATRQSSADVSKRFGYVCQDAW